MTRWFGLFALLALCARDGGAQDTAAVRNPTAARDSTAARDTSATLRPASTVTLSLQEALTQARANSPAYRQTLNDAGPAKWGVRNAYGNLLPGVSVGSDVGYTGSGQSNFGGGFVRPTSAFVTSGYNLSLQWQLNGRVLTAPGEQKALQRATDEDISGAGVELRAEIETQYLTTLQASAQVAVARQQVTRNVDFLTLAKARYQVGQATLLDVRQAEVAKGQSDVALLRAGQAENEAKLDLLRRMGVEPPVAVDQIALSDSFPVTEPTYQLDSLLRLADEQNPSLRSLRARRTAATYGVRSAKSEFLPTLSAQAGWSGFTQEFTSENFLIDQTLADAQSQAAGCQSNNEVRAAVGLGTSDCFAAAGLNSTGTALQDPVTQQIRDANNVFPFSYTGQPFQATLRVSLPIFTGFGRSLRLSQAKAQEQDADEGARARRLQVRSDVHARYLGLQTSFQAISVQEANRAAARDQLRLAQDRYRLGAGTSLEVSDAQNAVQRAEGDYVNAVYDYHKAIAALEAAVGRPLR
ncbi:MAG TPA: TolC family protein [Gemmatimonadales bacterium]|nr:TolC family protein [Gemmatimonadales bacterium]